MNQAQGLLVDDEGRCVHYHGEKDIVSLQCYECKNIMLVISATMLQKRMCFHPTPWSFLRIDRFYVDPVGIR